MTKFVTLVGITLLGFALYPCAAMLIGTLGALTRVRRARAANTNRVLVTTPAPSSTHCRRFRDTP